MFYCELLSGLWISDVNILQNKKFIIDNDIKIILNCTEIFDFPQIDDIKKIRLPFSSLQDNNNLSLLQKNYIKIINYINDNITNIEKDMIDEIKEKKNNKLNIKAKKTINKHNVNIIVSFD